MNKRDTVVKTNAKASTFDMHS